MCSLVLCVEVLDVSLAILCVSCQPYLAYILCLKTPLCEITRDMLLISMSTKVEIHCVFVM